MTASGSRKQIKTHKRLKLAHCFLLSKLKSVHSITTYVFSFVAKSIKAYTTHFNRMSWNSATLGENDSGDTRRHSSRWRLSPASRAALSLCCRAQGALVDGQKQAESSTTLGMSVQLVNSISLWD